MPPRTTHGPEDRKAAIREALRAGEERPFDEAAGLLLGCLGYASDRTLSTQTGDVDDFLAQWPSGSGGGPSTQTRSEGKFRTSAASARILFQVTDEEIRNSDQGLLFAGNEFDDGLHETFLFLSIELVDPSYSRADYASFTREVNRRFGMPAFVLFRAADGLLTLAFVHRRKHKTDRKRQVLGNVALVREIDPLCPHRAHLDILAELSLSSRLAWMNTHAKPTNFDGLLASLLDTLDIQELNKRFYRDLFRWFNRAVKEATFPTGQPRTLSSEEHVIRLITRLLFVWFIKEKDLIAEELFVEEQIAELLKGYDRDGGDSYYRAILQNLFFATLNCEVDQRGWSHRQQSTHRLFDRFRYRREIQDTDAVLDLFARTPFINGGLFDCLDSVESLTQGGYRIDCFSDNVTDKRRREYAIVSVPNRLFFDEDGLVTLFNRFKFTVEENTPTEVEVALDPELLGRVFENLLAAYNPETRETARKQTGSYYTPRPVVAYMVDEALVATLARRAQPADGDQAFWRERLQCLLDYEDAFDDASDLFEEAETDAVIRAIAALKVLDPACGSGAFPMGILHKLTLALRRLDPANERWERLQKELAQDRAAAAFDTRDQEARDAELKEISETFERYKGSDFGRKLYLIQNSIFGVDIQPVACQIAKLRFFISLAIEQHVDQDARNMGIKPLPNLETRFVAADALLRLSSERNRTLMSSIADELQGELRTNRERYFHARSRDEKLEAMDVDADLRQRLVAELSTVGLSSMEARRVSAWDPYDQGAVADWFDPQYMFGVTDGFDAILANPPYIESRNSLLSVSKKAAYGECVRADWGAQLPRGSDVLVYFFCRAAKFASDHGQCVFIVQNAWLSTDYGYEFQKFTDARFSFSRIVDTEGKFFSDIGSQNINAIIVLFSREQTEHIECSVLDTSLSLSRERTIVARQKRKWGHAIAMPEFFADALSCLDEQSAPESEVEFGQGLNFPLSRLSDAGDVPVVTGGSRFIAVDVDTFADVKLSSRRRVPALFMPRGVGNRHYCTMNAAGAYTYSHVEAYLPVDLQQTDYHYCVWLYLNSSLVWLYREITGRKNLGGGLLKAEATDMKSLPTAFDFDFGKDARKAARMLERDVLPTPEELYSDEHLFVDAVVFERFGLEGVAEDVRRALKEMVDFRLSRAKVNDRMA